MIFSLKAEGTICRKRYQAAARLAEELKTDPAAIQLPETPHSEAGFRTLKALNPDIILYEDCVWSIIWIGTQVVKRTDC